MIAGSTLQKKIVFVSVAVVTDPRRIRDWIGCIVGPNLGCDGSTMSGVVAVVVVVGD